MRRKPQFLVCETKVESPRWPGDDRPVGERTLTSWFTLCREEELAELPNYEQAGFGTEYESVRYEVHRVQVTEQFDDVTVALRTVRDEALRFSTDGRVDVALKGKGWDPKGVFWDVRGNSFAVVTPPPSCEGDARVVSEQGVVLVSINGIGEVRWTVLRSDAKYAENVEAVTHFGLTWSDPR